VSTRLDVVVVGGGPAGLAAALAARRAGLAVALVERGRPPLDKACGEGLMPSAVAALARLDVALPLRSAPFTGIRYVCGEAVAEADFPAGALGRGVRRTELHAALAAAAAAAGVELHWGCAATGLTAAGVATAAGELAARFVVGADGLRSKVRAWAGLARASRARRRFGVVRHFRRAPWVARVEVTFGDRVEAYVTPLADDEIGVALLWEGDGEGFDALLARRLPPALGSRLAGAPVLGRDRGAGPFRQRARAVAGRVALVGDAAGYVDALTGEGLALAFRQALALGPALAAGDLRGYARAARRDARVPAALTHLTLFVARRPALARRVVAALARDPELFSRLLGALGADGALAALGLARALAFAGHLLAPAPEPR
jgi:flavin-dependent dehydrogenase